MDLLTSERKITRILIHLSNVFKIKETQKIELRNEMEKKY